MPQYCVHLNVGFLATVCSVLLYLSMYPETRSFLEDKGTKNASILVYLFTLLSCLWWLCYGLFTHNSNIILLQSIGTLLSLHYVYAFNKYSTNEQKIKNKRLFTVMIFINTVLALMVFNPLFSNIWGNFRINAITIVANVYNIIMFTAPLETLGKTAVKRDTSLINMKLLFATIITAIFTILYAIEIGDIYYALPNAIGMIVSFFQCLVFALLECWLFFTDINRNKNIATTTGCNKLDSSVDGKISGNFKFKNIIKNTDDNGIDIWV